MTPAITHATQKELLCCTEIITYVRTYIRWHWGFWVRALLRTSIVRRLRALLAHAVRASHFPLWSSSVKIRTHMQHTFIRSLHPYFLSIIQHDFASYIASCSQPATNRQLKTYVCTYLSCRQSNRIAVSLRICRCHVQWMCQCACGGVRA